MSQVFGWGRFPQTEALVESPTSFAASRQFISASPKLIARGLGRSYGDSSLADIILDTRFLDCFLSFDEETGSLSCASGVTLEEILRVFMPRGWFLPVTPGTRHVTIGGAIASDIHGKNHHIEGTFTEHIESIDMLLGNGERICASPTEHSDLFHATCGGMGLTGVILSAKLRLKPIRSSSINLTTIRVPDLHSALAAFDENASSTYSVAWIDCLARDKHLGRSVVMLGEHADDGLLALKHEPLIPLPTRLPPNLVNQYSVKAFNTLYYGKAPRTPTTQCVGHEPFFFPLDKVIGWNRLYGSKGFLQYQLVIPSAVGLPGIATILEHIAASGRGSFLAVLKRLGKANQNHLSFPMDGYTLALDFNADPVVFSMLEKLDRLVHDYGGRLYLAKDARMSEAMFKATYSRWEEFQGIREKYHALGKFSSLQSQRLGLL